MQGYYRLNTTLLSDTYKCQLHVSAFMAIVRLDTKSEEKLHNTIWYRRNIVVYFFCAIFYYVVFPLILYAT